jgi:hypothetical protein
VAYVKLPAKFWREGFRKGEQRKETEPGASWI